MLKILLILIVLMLAVIAFRMVAGEDFGHQMRRRAGARICAARGHRRAASSVRKVEDQYFARCQRCGTRLAKARRDAEWLPHDAVATPRPAGPIAEDSAEGGQSGPVMLSIGIATLMATAIATGLLIAPHPVQRPQPDRIAPGARGF